MIGTILCLGSWGSSGDARLVGTSWSSSIGPGSRESKPWWRSPVLPGLAGPVPHHLGVDGAADTVGQLGVQLGQLVGAVDAGVGDVPHGGGLNDVPDDELLDGLVLGAGLGAVGAPHELDMATSVLVTSIVPALGSHLGFLI